MLAISNIDWIKFFYIILWHLINNFSQRFLLSVTMFTLTSVIYLALDDKEETTILNVYGFKFQSRHLDNHWVRNKQFVHTTFNVKIVHDKTQGTSINWLNFLDEINWFLVLPSCIPRACPLASTTRKYTVSSDGRRTKSWAKKWAGIAVIFCFCFCFSNEDKCNLKRIN